MQAGDQLANRFDLVELLGEGGMGQVFRAHDRQAGGEVAIKTLLPQLAGDPGAAEDLRREVHLCRRLNHHAIVKIYDYAIHGRTPFIVMEFVGGIPLHRYLFEQPSRRLTEPAFRQVADQVLDAVGYAHALGVIHRDLKPANVMVRPGGHVTLLDFGIATVARATYSRVTGKAVGLTVQYAAPEQINGDDPTPAVDVYALGCMFYELLSGRPPFYQGEILHQQLTKTPAPLQGASDAVTRVIMCCLEKDPARRFPSALEVQTALSGPTPANVGADRTIKIRVSSRAVVSASSSGEPAASRGAEPSASPVVTASTIAPEPATTSASRRSPAGRNRRLAIASSALVGASVIVAVVAMALGMSSRVQPPETVTPPVPSSSTVEAPTAPVPSELEPDQPLNPPSEAATPAIGPAAQSSPVEAGGETDTQRSTLPSVNAAALLARADEAFADARYDQAIDVYRTILKASPTHSSARAGLARAERARDAELQVLGTTSAPSAAANPAPPVTLAGAQVLLDQGRYDEAIAALEQRLRRVPSDAATRATLERARRAKEAEDRVLGRVKPQQ